MKVFKDKKTIIRIVIGSKINQLEINKEIKIVKANKPTILESLFFDFILEQSNIFEH